MKQVELLEIVQAEEVIIIIDTKNIVESLEIEVAEVVQVLAALLILGNKSKV